MTVADHTADEDPRGHAAPSLTDPSAVPTVAVPAGTDAVTEPAAATVAVTPNAPSQTEDSLEPRSGSPIKPGPMRSATEAGIPGTDAPRAGGGGHWWMDGGRWIVGDPGNIPAVEPLAAAPWSRPDNVSDSARLGSLTFCAASTRGVNHQLYAKPRQDAYAYWPTRCQNWIVGCVADGVSQGRRSHTAADIACREIVLEVAAWAEGREVPTRPLTWTELVRTIPWTAGIDIATQAIVAEATKVVLTLFTERGETEKATALREASLTEVDAAKIMATTAIGFCVGTAPNAEGALPYALAVAAGDSSALVLSKGVWQPITTVKNLGAEIASSSVRPLPMQSAIETSSGFLAPGEALVVVTDGIGDPLGSGTGTVGRFLAESWAAPCDPLAFGAQVGFVRKTFVDDRTAFVIWHSTP
jgi:serine/threonine protein phosphatase PrpC